MKSIMLDSFDLWRICCMADIELCRNQYGLKKSNAEFIAQENENGVPLAWYSVFNINELESKYKNGKHFNGKIVTNGHDISVLMKVDFVNFSWISIFLIYLYFFRVRTNQKRRKKD